MASLRTERVMPFLKAWAQKYKQPNAGFELGLTIAFPKTIIITLNATSHWNDFAQLAGAVEYTYCTFPEG